MRRTVAHWIGLALVLLVLSPLSVSAQSAIAGVVKDASGAVLPGVTVEATSGALIESSDVAVDPPMPAYRATLPAIPERLFPKTLESQSSVVVFVPDADAAEMMASGSAAVRLARYATCLMNPRSSERFAVIAAIAGMVASNPFVTADSDSPVWPVTRDRISGVRSAFIFSSMEAMCRLPLGLIAQPRRPQMTFQNEGRGVQFRGSSSEQHSSIAEAGPRLQSAAGLLTCHHSCDRHHAIRSTPTSRRPRPHVDDQTREA